MAESNALAYALAGAAIATGFISLFVGVKRWSQPDRPPFSLRYLASSRRDHATHPITLVVNGAVLVAGGVAAMIWL